MSDSINPIGIVSAAAIGGVSAAGASYLTKKAVSAYKHAAKDTFVKRTVKATSKKMNSIKESINKKINMKNIRETYTSAKEAVKGFFNKPTMKNITGFLKKPVVAGALIGIAAYIAIKKVAQAINNQ